MTNVAIDWCGRPLVLTQDEFQAALKRGQRLLQPGLPATPEPQTGFMDGKQMAEDVNVPVTWLMEAARQGRIPSVMVGRYRRFDPPVVREALKRAGGPSGSQPVG